VFNTDKLLKIVFPCLQQNYLNRE